MTTVVVGCDSNNESNEKYQKTVANAIKNAGFEVETLPIGPDPYADYSWGKNGKNPQGKIGVYLMAASLISFLDGSDGKFDYNVFGIRGDVTGWTNEEWKTKPIHKDPDGNYSHPRYDECDGKTYPQLNELFKGHAVAVPGENENDLAKNIVEALNGTYVGSDSNDNNQGQEDEEEEWDDKDNFTPHKGKIMEIKPYKEISSISFDKSYDSPTGTGNVEIRFGSKDYRFLYKGVAMKLKLRRSCDKEFSATGLEEPDYDEDEKFFKEHIPTNELLEELGLPNYRKQQRTSPTGTSSTSDTEIPTGDESGDGSSSGSNTGVRANYSTGSGGSSGSNTGVRANYSTGNSGSSSSGKQRLSRQYINSLSPSTARAMSGRTNDYDATTIKALRRRALGLFW